MKIHLKNANMLLVLFTRSHRW